MAASPGFGADIDPRASTWRHCLEYMALSDVGMRRANNQDSYAVALASGSDGWLRRGHLFLVADGMGAHAAGELASKLAADNIALSYLKHSQMPAPQALQQAVQEANELIHRRASTSDDFRGMGTTCTALALIPQGAVVAHVGDSRAYRVRGPAIEQLTFDHSLVWEMKAAGQIQSEQASMYVPKNIITRSLGPNPKAQVDVEGPLPLQIGDTFLLCSDGLSGQVEDNEIGALLYSLPVEKAVRALVDLANLRGGPDNITVVAARVTGPQVPRNGGDATPASRPPEAKGPVSPVVWVLAGVFFLAALVLLTMGRYQGALFGLVGGLLATVIGWLSRPGVRDEPIMTESAPQGRGPYVRASAVPDVAFVDRLAETARELREAAGDWGVDWGPFDAWEAKAVAARRGNDLVTAVRAYCEAICYMMDQLRHQKAGG